MTVGSLVNILGLQTSIAVKGMRILEIRDYGFIATREDAKGGKYNPIFYSWAQVREVEILGGLDLGDTKIKQTGRPRATTGA